MSYSVYKHTFPNGKVYIGITSMKPETRWKNGKGYLKKKKNGEYSQPLVANAILKYGWDNIKHEILYSGFDKVKAEQKEVELIFRYKSNKKEFGYNIENGGNAIGKLSNETKVKISKTLKDKGSVRGENNPNFGNIASDNTRKKMSENRTNLYGKDNHMYGKTHSEETKRKISLSNKGKNSGKKNPAYGKSGDALKKQVCQYTKDNVLICIYESLMQAERNTGISHGHISSCCRGKRKTAGGFRWKYADGSDFNELAI